MLGVFSVCALLTIAALARSARADVVAPSSAPPEVRVLLAQVPANRSIALRGFDLRFQSIAAGRDPAATPSPVQELRTEWRVSCRRAIPGATPAAEAPARVVFERAGASVASAQPVPGGGRFRVIDSPARIESAGGFITLADRPYRGALFVHAHEKDDGCDIVNEVDLEQYLDGLVNAEFSSRWAPEGIAAQVVAARTYALHEMQQARKKGRRWDLDSTEKDQVYDGSAREDWKASRVIERTRGEVLVPNGAGIARAWDQQTLLKAYYHSTCGGFTELPENVWGAKSPGYKHPVSCGFCAASPRYRWNLELSESEIRSRISALFATNPELFPKAWRPSAQWSRRALSDLRIETLSASRALKIRAVFAGGVSLPLSAALLRQALGYGTLKSTAFRISRTAAGRFRFDGSGSGHGVGMCQWGAKVMGERGFSHDRILARYYPDARIIHLW